MSSHLIEAFKRYGSKELQERYLPRLAAGEMGTDQLSLPLDRTRFGQACHFFTSSLHLPFVSF